MLIELTAKHQRQLLNIARHCIDSGCNRSHPQKLVLEEITDAALQQEAASFVTLKTPAAHNSLELRGCIGTLTAHQPLAQDVNEHAFAAAFCDSRFEPVAAPEIDALVVSISVLTPYQAMTFSSREDLLDQLNPGSDGLLLECHGKRATFLPAVWETLPNKEEFMQRLLLKAGLKPHVWNEDIKVFRYTAVNFSEAT